MYYNRIIPLGTYYGGPYFRIFASSPAKGWIGCETMRKHSVWSFRPIGHILEVAHRHFLYRYSKNINPRADLV